MILIRLKKFRVKASNKSSKEGFLRIKIKIWWREAFTMIKNHNQNRANLVNISLMIEQNHKLNFIKEILRNSFEQIYNIIFK